MYLSIYLSKYYVDDELDSNLLWRYVHKSLMMVHIAFWPWETYVPTLRSQ